MQPTHGLVPGDGNIPLLRHNDMPGPMGRTVADVAALPGVIDTGDTDDAAGLAPGLLADGIAGGAQARALPCAIVARTSAGARPHPGALTDPGSRVGALPVVLGAVLRHDSMSHVTARHPDLATPDDLTAWNAADRAMRAPSGRTCLRS